MKTKENAVITGITQILTHARAHFDELVAWLLLVWYGEKFFPGVGKAKLYFAGETTEGSDEMFDSQGILRIACGGRFDEHQNGGSGRLPGKCSAILVAEYLGIQDAPYLKRLLAETLECDERNVSATRFPQIMKAAYRAFPNDPHFILNRSQRVVAAIVKAEMCKFAPKAGEPTLTSLFERVLKERAQHFTDERAIAHIKGLFAQSDRAGEDLVTELSFIVKAMYRKDDSDEAMQDIYEWVLFVSQILYADQMTFRMARDFCRQNAEEHSVVAPSGRSFRLGVIRTDMDCVLQAMLYLKYDLVVIQNDRGQVQICTSKTAKSRGVSLVDVVRMWRWLEIPIEEKEKYSWESLGVAGRHDGVDNIYYHRGTSQNPVENAYNGTTTHPNVRPTVVALQAIIDLIKHAFIADGVRGWMRGRAIRFEERAQTSVKPVAKPIQKPEAPPAPMEIEPTEPVGPEESSVADLAEALEEKVEAGSPAETSTEPEAEPVGK